MTDIVDVARRVQYTGNGSAGPFSFSFQVNATTEIKVFVGTTQKTITTHYTVSLTSSGAGSVSFTSGNFPTSSETITIVSSVSLARSSVYTTGGPLTASALEADFDTNIMILQQSSQKVDRALAAPEFDATTIDMTLPEKDSRKGKILGFNATSGNPEVVGENATVTTIFNAIGDNTLTLTGTITYGSLSDGTITITAFVDEDDMSSNSATLVPTQQSVKAYVDSQVTAQDLDATTDSGTIAIDLDSETLTIAGGEGIDTSATGNTITIAGEEASTSNKGVASFSSTFFSVSSGAVSLVAAQTGITSLLATDIKIGEDDQTKIDFETADEIHFYAANAHQILLSDGVFRPQTDSDVDLGHTTTRWKNAYIDTITTTGNVSIGGDLDVTGSFDMSDANITNIGSIALDTITNDGSDITLDSSGTIILDADGSGQVEFKDNGVSYGSVNSSGGTGMNLVVSQADENFEIYGTDGSTIIKALEISMANDGAALFKSSVTATSFVGALTGNVTGNVSGNAETVTITANNSANETVYPVFVDGATGTQGLESDTGLSYNPSTGLLSTDSLITGASTFTGNVSHNDNVKAIFGTGGDLEIYHDGAGSYIDDTGTGRLYLRGSDRVQIQKYNSDSGLIEDGITFLEDGAVKIYHDNAKKLETTSSGVTVTGGLTAATGAFTDSVDINIADGDADNAYALTIRNNETTDSRSYGVQIKAGSTSTDKVLDLKQHDGTSLHQFNGDGTISFGNNVLVGSTSTLSSAKLLVKGTKSGTGGNAGQLVVLDDTAYSTTDNGGAIQFAGNFYDGGQVVFATVQGVKSNNTDANNAGDLIFTTKANGGDQTTKMRINDAGAVLIGRDSVGNTGNGHSIRGGDSAIFSRDATGESVQIGRNANDGQLIQFRDNGSEVGDIRVDGTTVSLTGFAGNHESSGISETTEVGTVVSTIDELDTRKLADGSVVDHKNHAKIKVSDSVGDKRVYGVLNKFVEHSSGLTKALVTSVGISSIKVTGACEGGDLLESNGDGTAKVQSDDIIRSKTIGKVTIGNSTTSVKLVSCVLYCG